VAATGCVGRCTSITTRPSTAVSRSNSIVNGIGQPPKSRNNLFAEAQHSDGASDHPGEKRCSVDEGIHPDGFIICMRALTNGTHPIERWYSER
jgi:hypothetical protein